MHEVNFLHVAQSVGSTSESIFKVASDMIFLIQQKGHLDAHDEEKSRQLNGIKFYTEEVNVVVLDWIGIAAFEQLKNFMSQANDLFRKDEKEKIPDRPAEAESILNHLARLYTVAQVYLLRTNFAKGAAQLAPEINRAWRDILKFMFFRDRPLVVDDLIDEGFFPDTQSAYKLITKFSIEGFVEVISGREIELSMYGREICMRFLLTKQEFAEDSLQGKVLKEAQQEPPQNESDDAAYAYVHGIFEDCTDKFEAWGKLMQLVRAGVKEYDRIEKSSTEKILANFKS